MGLPYTKNFAGDSKVAVAGKKASEDICGDSPVLEDLFLGLPFMLDQHSPQSPCYPFMNRIARSEVKRLFSDRQERVRDLKPFGSFVFPYQSMGTIDSLNLFDFSELILFSFYWMNRFSYRRVADVGANLGLHSIILSRSGFEVRAFEPDPWHFALLQRNLKLNHCFDVRVFNKAVSNREGKREFVRVLNNTTANHIAGSKPNPYGPLERLSVEVESIGSLIRWADLIKLDVEGHEKEILLETGREDWMNTDALVEVQNEANAKALYEHFSGLGVHLFSQKTNWSRVRDFMEMPMSYHEGTLFISMKNEMPWRECEAPKWCSGVNQ